MDNPIEELILFSKNGAISMVKIEWWLLKYQAFYDSHRGKRNEIELPALSAYASQEDHFVDIFEKLEKLSRLSKNEEYFKEQISQYESGLNRNNQMKSWVLENIEIYENHYISFLLDYLDYYEFQEESHLLINSIYDVNHNVFIDRADFRYTLKFLEIFEMIH